MIKKKIERERERERERESEREINMARVIWLGFMDYIDSRKLDYTLKV